MKRYQVEQFSTHCVVWLIHLSTNPFKEVVFSRRTEDRVQQCLNYKEWAERKHKKLSPIL